MPSGSIITFYSYKGGVGRTMALANVAVVLSQWGYRVLCIDWDLEAPGLHYYLPPSKETDQIPGLTELILGLPEQQMALRDHEGDQPPGGTSNTYTERNGEASEYAERREQETSAEYGVGGWQRHVTQVFVDGTSQPIDLIKAGIMDDQYLVRVQTIDWPMLYSQHRMGKFIETLRHEWKNGYDFVLIDSRTGITDIGGVCAIQLPDLLVLLFAANSQGLDGIAQIARSITHERGRLPVDRPRVSMLPIITAFAGRFEVKLGRDWLRRCEEKVGFLYRSWAHKNVTVAELMRHTRVPYVPRWSFGEKLPVLEEDRDDPESVSYALQTIAALVAKRLADSDVLVRDRNGYLAEASGAVAVAKPSPAGPKVFISCASADRDWLERFITHLSPLKHSGLVSIVDAQLLGLDESVEIANERIIRATDIIIILLSADYVASDMTRREMNHILRRAQEGAVVLAVVLRPMDLQWGQVSKYASLFNAGRPLSVVDDLDTALAELTAKVRDVAEEWIERGAPANAEAIFSRQGRDVRGQLPNLLAALVTVDPATDDVVAREVPLQHLDESPQRARLVDVLLEARILLAEEKEDKITVVRLRNKALFEEWPRLRSWLEDNRRLLHTRSKVEDAYNRWHEMRRRRDYLLADVELLADAEYLMRAPREWLTEPVVEYINESIAYQHERMAEKRVLDVGRLEALQAATHRLAQRWRGIALALVGVSGVSIIVASASVFVWQQAEIERSRAVEARSLALTRAAEQAVAEGNPDLAILLALEALPTNTFDRAEPVVQEAKGALYRALIAQGPQATLRVDNGIISRVAFSPDGALVLTGSLDGTARVWNVSVERMLATLADHAGSITAAAFDPAGRVVTATQDGTARLWDAASGAPLLTLAVHGGPVTAAAFSPTGQFVLTGSQDGTARLWDLSAGRMLTAVRASEGPIIEAAYTPSGEQIVTASQDGSARLWDPEKGVELVVLREAADGVTGVGVSPDGRYVATALRDGRVQLWRVPPIGLDQLVEYASSMVERQLRPQERARFLFYGE